MGARRCLGADLGAFIGFNMLQLVRGLLIATQGPPASCNRVCFVALFYCVVTSLAHVWQFGVLCLNPVCFHIPYDF